MCQPLPEALNLHSHLAVISTLQDGSLFNGKEKIKDQRG